MGRKAGVVSIDIDAGTAKFMVDMDKANTKLAEFGKKSTESGHATVTSMQASSAALRLLDNPMGNNIRAVERFISLLPGMGALMQKAFFAVGAFATADIFVRMGSEAVEFFKKVEQAPQRIAQAFRELNQPLRMTNDELALSNERLENEIAKLNGKPQNHVAEALLEAKVAADKLADSLDSDLKKLQDLMEKHSVSRFEGFFTGTATTKGDQDEVDRFRSSLGDADTRGQTAVDAAKGKEQISAAMKAWGDEVSRLITAEIGEFKSRLAASQTAQNTRVTSYDPVTGRQTQISRPGPDQSAVIAERSGMLTNLNELLNVSRLRFEGSALESQKGPAEEASQARTKAAETTLELQKKLTAAKEAQASAMDRIMIAANAEFNRLADINQLTDQNIALVKETVAIQGATETKKQIDEYNKAMDEFTAKWTKLDIEAQGALSRMNEGAVADGVKALEEHAKSAVEWAKQYNKITGESASESVRHQTAMAGISGNPNDPLGTIRIQQAIELNAIEDEYLDKLKSANSELDRSIALREKNLETARVNNKVEEETARIREQNDITRMLENGGIDMLSSNAAKLMTGQHSSFGKDFQQLGQQIAQSVVKLQLQQLMARFTGHKNKPTLAAGDPGHVIVDNLPGGGPASSAGQTGTPGAAKSGFWGPLLGALVGGVAGGIGGVGGGGTDVFSTISYGGGKAGGGPVDAMTMYDVGENGPERVLMAGRGSVVPHSQMGGDQHNYYINAAPGVSKSEMYQAVMAAHKSSVSTGVRATVEFQKRTPQRR